MSNFNELTIFRDLNRSLIGEHNSTAVHKIAELQDKVTTILFCSRQEELAHYLICDDPVLRELATRRYKSYE
jgi:hypothetical protein